VAAARRAPRGSAPAPAGLETAHGLAARSASQPAALGPALACTLARLAPAASARSRNEPLGRLALLPRAASDGTRPSPRLALGPRTQQASAIRSRGPLSAVRGRPWLRLSRRGLAHRACALGPKQGATRPHSLVVVVPGQVDVPHLAISLKHAAHVLGAGGMGRGGVCVQRRAARCCARAAAAGATARGGRRAAGGVPAAAAVPGGSQCARGPAGPQAPGACCGAGRGAHTTAAAAAAAARMCSPRVDRQVADQQGHALGAGAVARAPAPAPALPARAAARGRPRARVGRHGGCNVGHGGPGKRPEWRDRPMRAAIMGAAAGDGRAGRARRAGTSPPQPPPECPSRAA
jgi:hypothetical protein